STLAFWLRAAGFTPVLIESAPALRTGGYVIDFWGRGYEIAQRMGLEPNLNRVGYHIREMRIVNDRGIRIAGFGTKVFGELTGGRFVTLARSDLAQVLFKNIEPSTEVLFGDEIVALEERSDFVEVKFRHAPMRRFDLVVGADGLHSNVRKLAFGPEESFETRLGYVAAAFEVPGYRPRDEEVYVIYGRAGKMLGRFALHDDRTLFLFVFATDRDVPIAALDLRAQKRILYEQFGRELWECRRILTELDRAQDLYFDRVSQIKMESWSRGRIALVGDAAFCISLTGGQGSALAMTAAYVLAGELARARGAHERAFRLYEQTLRSFIVSKQRAAGRFAVAFAPRTRWGLWLRNQVIRAAVVPGIARLALSRDIIDTLELPEYEWPGTLATRR
ncbi:MAG TPA: FAD-binding domain, partial [Steroidobacteraceae bacterium]